MRALPGLALRRESGVAGLPFSDGAAAQPAADGFPPLPRWCTLACNPQDISHWSFEKLADTKLGVIAIESRDVSCDYKPHKPAKNPWGQRSGPDRGPPGNWNPSMDKRPYKVMQG